MGQEATSGGGVSLDCVDDMRGLTAAPKSARKQQSSIHSLNQSILSRYVSTMEGVGSACGYATYVGANGRLSDTVNAKGVVEPPSNRPVAIDCYGKTLDQLRSVGRVIEFPTHLGEARFDRKAWSRVADP